MHVFDCVNVCGNFRTNKGGGGGGGGGGENVKPRKNEFFRKGANQ